MSFVYFQEVQQDVEQLLTREVSPGVPILATYNTQEPAVFSGGVPPDTRVVSQGVEAIIDDVSETNIINFFNSSRIESKFKITLSLWMPWHITEVNLAESPKILSLFEPLEVYGGKSIVQQFQLITKYRFQSIGTSELATEETPQITSFYWLPEPSVCSLEQI